MDTTSSDSNFATYVLEECVQHGRQLLALQLPLVEAKNYDLMPEARKMTIQLYLVGVMWRFGEQFEMPTNARDRGFICLMSMLISDGMGTKDAQARISFLNSISRTPTGADNLAILIGHDFGTKQGALVLIFDHLIKSPEIAGAPWRIISRSKPVAAILVVTSLLISLLLGRSWVEAIGVGLIAGLSTLAIAVAISNQMKKEKGKSP
jgi:hypothetical protein